MVVEKLSDGGIRIYGDDGSAVDTMEIPDGKDEIVIDCDVKNLSVTGSGLGVVVNGKIQNLSVSGDNNSISGTGSVGSVLLEEGVNTVTVALDNTNVVNHTGNTVAVTGKDGTITNVNAGASATVNTTKSASNSSNTSNTYQVTFHSNGGGDIRAKSVSEGSPAGTLPIPNKQDMIFLGWYTDNGTFENEVTGETPVISNLDLYANYMPGTPPDQIDEQTTTSVMDVDTHFSVTVLSSNSSMTAENVKGKITADPITEDEDQFGGISVAGGGGSYTVTATGGYTPGCSYSLTLTDGALTFEGEPGTVRTYNITVAMPEPTLNLKLDNSVKAIPAAVLDNIYQYIDGELEPVDSIFAPLYDMDMDGEAVPEISGTFVYSPGPGDPELFLGDKLAIYEGTAPA